MISHFFHRYIFFNCPRCFEVARICPQSKLFLNLRQEDSREERSFSTNKEEGKHIFYSFSFHCIHFVKKKGKNSNFKTPVYACASVDELTTIDTKSNTFTVRLSLLLIFDIDISKVNYTIYPSQL